MPLRRITNFLPPPSSIPPSKTRTSISTTLPVSTYDKENVSKMVMSSTKTKKSLKARRGSFVFKPPPASNQVVKSKRQASISTLRAQLNSNMKTPLNSSTARSRTDRMMGRQSFGWDPQRVWCTSRVRSPLPKLKEAAATTVMATPTALRSPPRLIGSWKPKHPTVVALQKKHSVWSPLATLKEAADTTVMATAAAQTSGKFLRSPPALVGSWKPKHPTVVALQKKHLVWSPLKLRGTRNNRKSLLLS